jgi:hypothetical protein
MTKLSRRTKKGRLSQMTTIDLMANVASKVRESKRGISCFDPDTLSPEKKFGSQPEF